jgi:hypothetical protein
MLKTPSRDNATPSRDDATSRMLEGRLEERAGTAASSLGSEESEQSDTQDLPDHGHGLAPMQHAHEREIWSKSAYGKSRRVDWIHQGNRWLQSSLRESASPVMVAGGLDGRVAKVGRRNHE